MTKVLFDAEDNAWLLLFAAACRSSTETLTGAQLAAQYVSDVSEMAKKYVEVLLLTLSLQLRREIVSFSQHPESTWKELIKILKSLKAVLPHESMAAYVSLLLEIPPLNHHPDCHKLLLGLWAWITHFQETILTATNDLNCRMNELEFSTQSEFPFV